MIRRPYRSWPLVAALALAVVGLFLMAVRQGWLGPNVGRGGNFCEAPGAGWILQPANTSSNLAFVVAGLAVAGYAGRHGVALRGQRWLATAYAVVVVLLGPASAAMHATESALGGHLDMLSMYLVASFAAGYAVARLARAGAGAVVGLFVLGVLTCELVSSIHHPVPVVDTTGNAIFAALLVLALGGELLLWRRGDPRQELRLGGGAVASMLLAFGIWNLSKDGTALCHPHSLAQGHAAWHVLCALAAYLLFRHYAAEEPGP